MNLCRDIVDKLSGISNEPENAIVVELLTLGRVQEGGGVPDINKLIGWLEITNDGKSLISTIFTNTVVENIITDNKGNPSDILEYLYEYFMPPGQMVGAPHGTEHMIHTFAEFYRRATQIYTDYTIEAKFVNDDEDRNIIPHIIGRMTENSDETLPVSDTWLPIIDRVLEDINISTNLINDYVVDKKEQEKIDQAKPPDTAQSNAAHGKIGVKKPYISNFFGLLSSDDTSSLEHIDGNKSLKIRVENSSLIIDIANGDSKGVVTIPLESVFSSKHLTIGPPGNEISLDVWVDTFLKKKSSAKDSAKDSASKDGAAIAASEEGSKIAASKEGKDGAAIAAIAASEEGKEGEEDEEGKEGKEGSKGVASEEGSASEEGKEGEEGEEGKEGKEGKEGQEGSKGAASEEGEEEGDGGAAIED